MTVTSTTRVGKIPNRVALTARVVFEGGVYCGASAISLIEKNGVFLSISKGYKISDF